MFKQIESIEEIEMMFYETGRMRETMCAKVGGHAGRVTLPRNGGRRGYSRCCASNRLDYIMPRDINRCDYIMRRDVFSAKFCLMVVEA